MSTVPTATHESMPVSGGLSEGARLLNTLVAPTRTFTDLKRNARWWVPWLLMAAMSYAMVAVVASKIGLGQVSENQMKMNPSQMERLEKAPPEQQARAKAIGVTITKAISYSYPAISLVILTIIAAVLMGTFNFLAGADVPFKVALAVVMYASLPGIIKAALVVVSLLAGAAPENFTFQNPLASNLGWLVDPGESRVLYTLGSAIDLFMFWTLALTAIGFTCVSKVKRGTAFAVVFGWWAVLTLIGVAAAAIRLG